ncbi:MAG: hypothetical protein ACRC7N_20685 [Clostridium sp.]
MLGRSEEEFWESTPKKLYSQIEIHIKIKSSTNTNTKPNSLNKTSGEVVRMKVTN